MEQDRNKEKTPIWRNRQHKNEDKGPFFWDRLQFAFSLTALRLPRSTQTHKLLTPEYQRTWPSLFNKRNMKKIKAFSQGNQTHPASPFTTALYSNFTALPQGPLLPPSHTHLLPTSTTLWDLHISAHHSCSWQPTLDVHTLNLLPRTLMSLKSPCLFADHANWQLLKLY